MIKLTPGLAQGCFELVRFASHSSATFVEMRASFSHIGGIDCAKVIETVQALRWLSASEFGQAIVTPTGARLVALTSYEAALRQALLDYIDIERPAWIQNATYGRARVIAFAGSEVGQTFVEAGLASGVEEDVIAFWDALAARARGQRNERLTNIGRQGERQTIIYEKGRTRRAPKWISVDDNADGYDVLSIVEADDPRPLSIEVKASTIGVAGVFHLTRNEWERAQEFECHTFHLWNLKDSRNPSLAVVTPRDMGGHVPNDNGKGSWESVEVPLAAFRDRFVLSPGT